MNLQDESFWLVWSVEHNAWWKSDESGYTKEVSEAGRYTIAQARFICLRANQVCGNTPQETIVRADDMENYS